MPMSLKVLQYLADGKKYRTKEFVKKYLAFDLARSLSQRFNEKMEEDAVKSFASLHIDSIKGNLRKVLDNLAKFGLIQCDRGVKPKYFLKWPVSYDLCLKKVETQEEMLSAEINSLGFDLFSAHYMLENSNSESESRKFKEKCEILEKKIHKKFDEHDLCRQTAVILTKYIEDFKARNTLQESSTIVSMNWSPALAELMRIATNIEPRCKSRVDAELLASKLYPDLLKADREWQMAYGYCSENAKIASITSLKTCMNLLRYIRFKKL